MIQPLFNEDFGAVGEVRARRTRQAKHALPIPRSPLRYPGGKSRGVKEIMKLIPPGLDRICSPFFGGGSIELACAARGIRVFGYDKFSPVVDFWHELLLSPAELEERVRCYYPLSRTKFYFLQKRFFTITDRTQRAAIFFALNRSSFSGTTLSGGMSPNHPRFTPSSIERLGSFHVEGVSVKQEDFHDSLARHKQDFLYLDPPYMNGEKLYGDRGNAHIDFDHVGLAKHLQKRKGWVLSYNDSPKVRKLYDGFKTLTPEWTYGMSKHKNSRELLILSKDSS